MTPSERWHCLLHGNLSALPRTPEGRADLREISVQVAPVVARREVAAWDVERVDLSDHRIERKVIEKVDFSGSDLRDVVFIDCTLTDCCFDKCSLVDVGVCDSEFSRCTFRSTKLRGCSFGPLAEPISGVSSYRDCDFSGARLGIFSLGALYERCTFKAIRATRIDLHQTCFVDCVFGGILREVRFWRTNTVAMERGWLRPNDMAGCSFEEATLHCVAFLDMDPAFRLPSKQHLIIGDWPSWYSRVSRVLKDRSDPASKALSTWLAVRDQWGLGLMRFAVISEAELLEEGGPECVALAYELA